MQTHKKKTGQAEHVCPNCRRRYLRRLYRQASRFSDSVDQEWRNPNSQHRAVATSIEAKLLPPTIRIMVHRRRQACQTMAETNEKNSGLLRLMMKVTSRTFCPAEAAQGSSRGETKTQPKCLPREIYSCCVCVSVCAFVVAVRCWYFAASAGDAASEAPSVVRLASLVDC